jgi:hypothetical protein
MTRKTIASGARRCSPSQTVTPLCRALLKTGNSKDRVGAIRRVVELSMINGRAPLTRLTEEFRQQFRCFRAPQRFKNMRNVSDIPEP